MTSLTSLWSSVSRGKAKLMAKSSWETRIWPAERPKTPRGRTRQQWKELFVMANALFLGSHGLTQHSLTPWAEGADA